jgi:hypothetical protein
MIALSGSQIKPAALPEVADFKVGSGKQAPLYLKSGILPYYVKRFNSAFLREILSLASLA